MISSIRGRRNGGTPLIEGGGKRDLVMGVNDGAPGAGYILCWYVTGREMQLLSPFHLKSICESHNPLQDENKNIQKDLKHTKRSPP